MNKTHCNGKCKLDSSRKSCLSCNRTVEEIKQWYILSPDEQQKVLDDYNKGVT